MDMLLNAMLKPPKLKNIKKAICVQPHPDDNEVGMGGIIAKLAKEGCQIHYITVTDGSLGLLDASLTHDELAIKRKEEIEASGKLLGVNHFHYLNHKDGTLKDIHEIAGQIGEIIRTIKPEFIFCPDPWLNYEAHQDHIITGKAVAQSFISTWLHEYPLGTKTKPHKVKGIGFYFTSRPNTIIDITDTFDLKMKAIGKHKSQFDKKTLMMFSIYFKDKAKKAAINEKYKLGAQLKILGQNHLHCFVDAENV
ncbi:PIG-L deacetylase family protein [Candidatus Izemoplasma sp. B36]|uniref:PIG-L deacetylase family protein n=1 Tax=Candidatus Izemoplasma sp. B36 TaxID=3242468 RepID=UPI0035574E20